MLRLVRGGSYQRISSFSPLHSLIVFLCLLKLSKAEAARGGLFPITVPVIVPCPRCRKSGFWEDFFCPACHGYRSIQIERESSLSIPPHVRHGTEIRVSTEDIGLRDVYLNIVVL